MSDVDVENAAEERESMEYDVVIVGAGPAGLSAAIRLKQLAAEKGAELSVCVLEKGSGVGMHLISGAVLDPKALNELIPDWEERGAPKGTPVSSDSFCYFTKKSRIRLPAPPQMHNHGNNIISLGLFGKWLGEQAEELGVEIFPGFAASEILYDDDGAVRGVATGAFGIGKDGKKTGNYQAPMDLYAKQTIFAEGCRGSLSKIIIKKFGLDEGRDPQHYSLGVKEVWEVPPEQSRPGHVLHSIGWPMDNKTYGGGFLYHMEDNLVTLGFVMGLEYENPHLSPYEEMQRYKTHPAIATYLKGGRRLGYGARAIVTGGLQSLPKLTFAGGCLIGDTAGFLNVPRIKGNHTAMKSGMLCAEAVFDNLMAEKPLKEVVDYEKRFKESWLYDELFKVRNAKPPFKKGLLYALAYNALDTYIFRGKAPWTLRSPKPDYEYLKPAAEMPKIEYPKPDGKLTFARLDSVALSNTYHEENQPCHLILQDDTIPVEVNLKTYDGPEALYCPAGVYEFIDGENGGKKLQINAPNCIHCKTCDIKDPEQNITWVCPEGGGGPNYEAM